MTGAVATGRARTAGEEANLRLVRAMYDAVLGPLDAARVDDFFRSDYIQHSPIAETGAAGLKRFLAWARETSPEARHHVKRLLVDGDYVIGHVHVVIRPGERGHVAIDIFRIENGRIAEHWDATQPVPESAGNANGLF
jgi:predicted SnoaL-like aldol condensation-catalyzing enzyme